LLRAVEQLSIGNVVVVRVRNDRHEPGAAAFALALVAELAQRLGPPPALTASGTHRPRKAAQPNDLRERQMRMRPVALDVGREITRRSHFVVILDGMYKIIHRCRVKDMSGVGDLLKRAAMVAAVALFSTAPASSQSLVLARTIDLPAVTGRIDHLDVDLEGNRLFVAALAAGSLEVVDLASGKRIARFMPLSEPQGVAYLPARHRVVVASGSNGRLEAYDSAPSAVAGIGHLDDADKRPLRCAVGSPVRRLRPRAGSP